VGGLRDRLSLTMDIRTENQQNPVADEVGAFDEKVAPVEPELAEPQMLERESWT